MRIGRYINAPLIYVVAQLRMNFLGLNKDDKTRLGQALQKTRYRRDETASDTVPVVNLNENQNISASEKVIDRYVFFSLDRHHAVIFNETDKVIEFRTSAYKDSAEFMSDIQSVLDAISSAVPSASNFSLAEITFHYVDVIAPINANRRLGDYFNDDYRILPLACIANKSQEDALQFGAVRVSRIMNDNRTRVDVELEQLQYKKLPNGESIRIKYLPEPLIEKNTKLSMPINLPSWFKKDEIFDYALLWTNAGKLPEKDLSLGDKEVMEYCKQTHRIAKESFNNLLNKRVCDSDWQWINKETH